MPWTPPATSALWRRGLGWGQAVLGRRKQLLVHVFACPCITDPAFLIHHQWRELKKLPTSLSLPFSPLPHQALTGVVLLQHQLWNDLGSKHPAVSQFLEGVCDPGDVWCRQSTAPSCSPAQQGWGTAPCVSKFHPPSRQWPSHTPPPELAHSSHIPSALLSSFPFHTQQRTYQRTHLLHEIKAVTSAQNFLGPSQCPPLSYYVTSITPPSPELPDCCWNGWGNPPFQSKEKALLRTSLFPPLFHQKWCFW